MPAKKGKINRSKIAFFMLRCYNSIVFFIEQCKIVFDNKKGLCQAMFVKNSMKGEAMNKKLITMVFVSVLSFSVFAAVAPPAVEPSVKNKITPEKMVGVGIDQLDPGPVITTPPYLPDRITINTNNSPNVLLQSTSYGWISLAVLKNSVSSVAEKASISYKAKNMLLRSKQAYLHQLKASVLFEVKENSVLATSSRIFDNHVYLRLEFVKSNPETGETSPLYIGVCRIDDEVAPSAGVVFASDANKFVDFYLTEPDRVGTRRYTIYSRLGINHLDPAFYTIKASVVGGVNATNNGISIVNMQLKEMKIEVYRP